MIKVFKMRHRYWIVKLFLFKPQRALSTTGVIMTADFLKSFVQKPIEEMQKVVEQKIKMFGSVNKI